MEPLSLQAGPMSARFPRLMCPRPGTLHLGHSLEFGRLLDRNCRVGVLARSADLLSSLVVRRGVV